MAPLQINFDMNFDRSLINGKLRKDEKSGKKLHFFFHLIEAYTSHRADKNF